MSDRNRALTPGDLDLFRYFFRFIAAAAERQLKELNDQFAIMKSVFLNLLNSLPVSDYLSYQGLGVVK
jgi:hypothetical protein